MIRQIGTRGIQNDSKLTIFIPASLEVQMPANAIHTRTLLNLDEGADGILHQIICFFVL